jgi:hypothetical protein
VNLGCHEPAAAYLVWRAHMIPVLALGTGLGIVGIIVVIVIVVLVIRIL